MSLFLLFTVTLLQVFAAIEGGFRLAVYFRRRQEAKGIDAPISSVIGGTLGLLAFLLAFTFGLAATRFEARRQLLLDEVNAIGTCHLRTDLLPDPQRVEIRERLREYVRLRAKLVLEPSALKQTVARAEVLQEEIWARAVQAAKKDGGSEMTALFVESLNTVIDYQTNRLVVGQYHIPGVIWLSLYFISALSMASVGYQFGNSGGRDMAMSLCLALSFSIVIALIADLDRNYEGTLQISQQPMLELDRKLSGPRP